jgi:hypothetical protein
VSTHLRWLPKRVVNGAMLDHARESLQSVWGERWYLDIQVDVADSRRIRSKRVLAGDDEPVCREFRCRSPSGAEAMVLRARGTMALGD